MKKVIMLALLIAAGSALNTASAQSKKKDKKNKATTECSETCKTAPIVLKSAADSLSYATGMTMTNGLDAYLEQQYNKGVNARLHQGLEGRNQQTQGCELRCSWSRNSR